MATISKRGPCYYLNWSDEGVQVRRSLGKIDREEAETLRVQKEAELRGLIVPTSGRTVRTVLQNYLDWSAKNRPAGHKGTYYALRPLMDAFGSYSAEKLSPELVERWVGEQTVAASTVAKSIKMARAAYRRAIRLRLIAESPFDRVDIPKDLTSRAPPWYTREQLDALFSAPRGGLWRFMANTGVRRGEMAKARRRDVRNAMLHVESLPTGRTKSGRWRWIPLNKAAEEALASLGEDRLVDVHPDTITDWFAEDLAALNKKRAEDKLPLLPEGSPHWLRHTFCTHLAQSGVSLHEIKQLAGHSSITVTEKYAHHLPDAGRSAIDKLNL